MRGTRTQRQSGTVVIALVAVLLLFGTYVMLGSLNIAAVRVDRDRATNEALAKAKEALIAYAVADVNRPGELPCPDVDNDGQLTLADFSGSNCASLIGRLPWRTLNLPDLRDDFGERLWYALSDDFHANGSVPLNSDTAFRTGNTSLTLTGKQTGTDLVAMIFAPGAPLIRQGAPAMQDRSAAGVLNAANYLDIAAGQDNADGNRIFVSADKSGSFNDGVLAIYSDDIMGLVQRRAAREYAQHLRDHFDAWQNATPPAGTNFVNFKGFYPWAARLDDPTVMQPGVRDKTNGQLPLSTSSVVWSTPSGVLVNCSGANTPQIQCTALAVGALITISGRVQDVGTGFVMPPTAANVTVVGGVVINAQTTWTLNAAPAAQSLDFTWTATPLALVTIKVQAPVASAWTSGTWLDQNGWHQDAFYAVSPGYAISGTNACGGACITVANTAAPNNDKQAVVLMAGRALPLAGQGVRPLAPTPVAAAQFFEGSNATPSSLAYEQNLRTASFNDMPIVVRP